jgi:hypothetical protein
MFQLAPVTATEMYNVDIFDAEESSCCVIYRYVLSTKVMCTVCNSILVTSLLVMGFNLLKTKLNLHYIRNQSVPRSRHSPTRLYKIDQLIMYEAKFALCSEIRTKPSTQSERHVELLLIYIFF